MLAGRTVLVVETEIIIALNIQAVLQELDAGHVIVATTQEEAIRLSASWAGAALAIVELERHKPELLELAKTVRQAGIPVLGMSADSRLSSDVPAISDTPIILKPIPDDALKAAIAAALG